MIKIKVRANVMLRRQINDPEYFTTNDDLEFGTVELPGVPRIGDWIESSDGYSEVVTSVTWIVGEDPIVEIGPPYE